MTTSLALDALSHRVISILNTASAVVFGSSKNNVESIEVFTLYKVDEGSTVSNELEQSDSAPNRRFIVQKCRKTN